MSDPTPSEISTRFRRNVVVSASAGTGKTHLLCSLYVLLSLGLTSMGEEDEHKAHPAILPERIVATTFSRAAALEMRARVEHALGALASGASDAPFWPEIERRLAVLEQAPSRGELVLLAKRAHEGLGRARIDTLHGLAGDLVRRHALLLGLPPGLAVGEEDALAEVAEETIEKTLSEALDQGSELALGAHTLLAALGNAPGTRERLRQFFDRLDEEGLTAADLQVADHEAARENLGQRARNALLAFGADAHPEMVAARPQALALLAQAADPQAENLPSAAEVAQRPEWQELVDRRKSQKRPTELSWFELLGELGKTKEAARQTLLAQLLEDRDLADRERAVLALLNLVGERLKQARLSRGLLGFGDLISLAHHGLRDRPDFAALCRAEVDALLVDEFQDSSRTQCELVYLLRERRRSHEQRTAGSLPGAQDVVGHGLFLVGDRKQSIYGFRGADVRVFGQMCAGLAGEQATRALELPAEFAGSRPTADFVALRESRRSAPAIVEFVNAFSQTDFSNAGLRYAEAEHLIARETAEGQRVVFVKHDGEPVSEPLARGPLRQAFAAAAFARSLTTNSDAPLSPGQIAILTRRRATIGLVELALGRLGLPYVVAGRALYDAREVRDVANLLRLVLDPRDGFALAAILRGPLVGLSDSALLDLASTTTGLAAVLTTGSDLDALRFGDEAKRLDDFRSRYRAARPALLRESPGRALRSMVREFGFDEVLCGLPRATATLANTERLVGIAQARGGTLLGFCRWLERQISDETDETEAVVFSPEDDAVRLTTIHGAKGLTFDATIVLDLESRSRGDSPPLAFDPSVTPPLLSIKHMSARGHRLPNAVADRVRQQSSDLAKEERRRITYVAITRPRRILALVGGESPTSDSAHQALLATAGVSELLETIPDSVLLSEMSAELGTAKAETPPRVELSTSSASPRKLTMATTPLGVFQGCPRRFRLRFLLGFEEPVHSGQLSMFEDPEPGEREETELADPRSEGRAAHRVLERLPQEQFGASALGVADLAALLAAEGLTETRSQALAPGLHRVLATDFAKSLVSPAVLGREDEFVVELSGEPALTLRGTIDLWVLRPAEKRIDIVDYKLTNTAHTETHRFQLVCYAVALAERFPDYRLRAGILPLLAGSEPSWLDSGDLEPSTLIKARRRLGQLAADLAEARVSGRFAPVAERRCRDLRCGFVTACHRKAARK